VASFHARKRRRQARLSAVNAPAAGSDVGAQCHVVTVPPERDDEPVPGRKTDVNDAQWLQPLHAYGLLRGSFHPPAAIAALRAYLRQRARLLDAAAAPVQHRQQALTQMNLKWQHVVADIAGQTGMRIIRAMLDGTRDPNVLAGYRDSRCKRSPCTTRTRSGSPPATGQSKRRSPP
jgi:hypothetical protein